MRSILSCFVLSFISFVGTPAVQGAQAPFDQLQLRSAGSYLGVHLLDVTEERADALKMSEARGTEVKAVEAGSPAEAAGIKPGDVLLTYNSENIVGGQQLGRLVEETPPGRKIRVEFWRNGKVHSIVVTTAAPPRHFASVPANPVGFDVSQPRFPMPEIPAPFLIWKSPMFGIDCEGIDSQLAQYFGVSRGVLVRSVVSGSAAEKSGLRAGDVLTRIGGKPVTTPRDLSSYMRMEHEPGKNVPLELMRNHKELKLSVQLPSDQQ